jgi:hypothetical protein
MAVFSRWLVIVLPAIRERVSGEMNKARSIYGTAFAFAHARSLLYPGHLASRIIYPILVIVELAS